MGEKVIINLEYNPPPIYARPATKKMANHHLKKYTSGCMERRITEKIFDSMQKKCTGERDGKFMSGFIYKRNEIGKLSLKYYPEDLKVINSHSNKVT